MILGQYKASMKEKVDVYSNTLTPTYFAAALYIDNARWDGVPFLVKTGIGLIQHRLDLLCGAFLLTYRSYLSNLYNSPIALTFRFSSNVYLE